jgi:hypothetical protein
MMGLLLLRRQNLTNRGEVESRFASLERNFRINNFTLSQSTIRPIIAAIDREKHFSARGICAVRVPLREQIIL